MAAPIRCRAFSIVMKTCREKIASGEILGNVTEASPQVVVVEKVAPRLLICPRLRGPTWWWWWH
jgi:hypothetical protein